MFSIRLIYIIWCLKVYTSLSKNVYYQWLRHSWMNKIRTKDLQTFSTLTLDHHHRHQKFPYVEIELRETTIKPQCVLTIFETHQSMKIRITWCNDHISYLVECGSQVFWRCNKRPFTIEVDIFCLVLFNFFSVFDLKFFNRLGFSTKPIIIWISFKRKRSK